MRTDSSKPGTAGTAAAKPGSEAAALPSVGSRVVLALSKATEKGTVAFAGSTDFAEGDWIGIVLDGPKGKNDGSVQGKEYFKCPPKHGLFVRPSALLEVDRQHESQTTGAAVGSAKSVKKKATPTSLASSASLDGDSDGISSKDGLPVEVTASTRRKAPPERTNTIVESAVGLPAVGAQVRFKYDKHQETGKVAYVGKTEFAEGDWVGIVMEKATGKNDGAVHGKRYFQCDANHGLFLRPASVLGILPDKSATRTPSTKVSIAEELIQERAKYQEQAALVEALKGKCATEAAMAESAGAMTETRRQAEALTHELHDVERQKMVESEEASAALAQSAAQLREEEAAHKRAMEEHRKAEAEVEAFRVQMKQEELASATRVQQATAAVEATEIIAREAARVEVDTLKEHLAREAEACAKYSEEASSIQVRSGRILRQEQEAVRAASEKTAQAQAEAESEIKELRAHLFEEQQLNLARSSSSGCTGSSVSALEAAQAALASALEAKGAVETEVHELLERLRQEEVDHVSEVQHAQATATMSQQEAEDATSKLMAAHAEVEALASSLKAEANAYAIHTEGVDNAVEALKAEVEESRKEAVEAQSNAQEELDAMRAQLHRRGSAYCSATASSSGEGGLDRFDQDSLLSSSSCKPLPPMAAQLRGAEIKRCAASESEVDQRELRREAEAKSHPVEGDPFLQEGVKEAHQSPRPAAEQPSVWGGFGIIFSTLRSDGLRGICCTSRGSAIGSHNVEPAMGPRLSGDSPHAPRRLTRRRKTFEAVTPPSLALASAARSRAAVG